MARSFCNNHCVWLNKSNSTLLPIMERAPNVSAALARRISSHLDAGYQPSIDGRRVVIRDVTLMRATGVEAPAAEEVRRQAARRGIPIEVSYWDRQAATDREGNRTFGYDIAGNRHLVAQRRNNQQVVTTQGRRFLY